MALVVHEVPFPSSFFLFLPALPTALQSTKSVEVRSHNIPKFSAVSNKMRSKNQRSTVNIMQTIIWNKPVASSPPLVSLTPSGISVQQPAPFNRPMQIRKITAT
jgi:hypothetical protein